MPRPHLAFLALALSAGLSAGGPPAALAPTEAIARLAKVDAQVPAVSKDEAALFEDAKDGKFDRYTFAEACLMAGGVADPRDRRKYRDKLDWMEAEARKATAGSKSVNEDAARLLKFLHSGPMAKGYKTEQTDLHVLLDTGEYNCVSSAALFTVVGRRIGLDVRAVEVPEHLFVVLATRGRKIDVETTSPYGFDPDPKRKVGPAKDGKAPERPADQRREVGEPGLAAVVAYNHGVTLSRQKKYGAAARANLVALALDPTNPHAVKNLTANLANWPVELSRAGKHEAAAAVLAVGRELAPKEEVLRNNTLAIFDAWADEAMKRKDWAGAVRVYEAGLQQMPGDKHLANNLAYCREQLRR